MIQANETLRIFIEFWPQGIRRSGFSPEEFLQQVSKQGFKICIIDEQEESLKSFTNVHDIMKFCQGEGHVNLFLEK